jgi:hypothetical protein
MNSNRKTLEFPYHFAQLIFKFLIRAHLFQLKKKWAVQEAMNGTLQTHHKPMLCTYDQYEEMHLHKILVT